MGWVGEHQASPNFQLITLVFCSALLPPYHPLINYLLLIAPSLVLYWPLITPSLITPYYPPVLITLLSSITPPVIRLQQNPVMNYPRINYPTPIINYPNHPLIFFCLFTPITPLFPQ